MTFNAQRAEALRSAIQGTVYRIKNYPEGDAKTLLTEHLALLQEAELIYLTDAFFGEGEEQIGAESNSVPPDIPETDPHAELRKTGAPGQRWQIRVAGEWVDLDNGMAPLWAPFASYRRHPDDVTAEQGWVNWAGGEIPVKRGTPIKVTHRSGEIYTTVVGGDYAVRWTCEYLTTDIVAYKVVK